MERLNVKAKKVMIELSKRYPNFEFYYTAISEWSDYLPEVATILDKKLTDEIVHTIDIEYSDMLDLELMDNWPRGYDGMTMVSLACFDPRWFAADEMAIRVKNGEIVSSSNIEVEDTSAFDVLNSVMQSETDMQKQLMKLAIIYLADLVKDVFPDNPEIKVEEFITNNGITFEYKECVNGNRIDGRLTIFEHGDIEAEFVGNIAR